MLRIQILATHLLNSTTATILTFFFKNKTNLHLKYYFADKLAKRLKDLILICNKIYSTFKNFKNKPIRRN